MWSWSKALCHSTALVDLSCGSESPSRFLPRSLLPLSLSGCTNLSPFICQLKYFLSKLYQKRDIAQFTMQNLAHGVDSGRPYKVVGGPPTGLLFQADHYSQYNWLQCDFPLWLPPSGRFSQRAALFKEAALGMLWYELLLPLFYVTATAAIQAT